MKVKEFLALWWTELKFNLDEFFISFQEDCICSLFLGILCLIPLVIYILYGLFRLIFICICIYNNRRLTVIDEHSILYHVRVVPV